MVGSGVRTILPLQCSFLDFRVVILGVGCFTTALLYLQYKHIFFKLVFHTVSEKKFEIKRGGCSSVG